MAKILFKIKSSTYSSNFHKIFIFKPNGMKQKKEAQRYLFKILFKNKRARDYNNKNNANINNT